MTTTLGLPFCVMTTASPPSDTSWISSFVRFFRSVMGRTRPAFIGHNIARHSDSRRCYVAMHGARRPRQPLLHHESRDSVASLSGSIWQNTRATQVEKSGRTQVGLAQFLATKAPRFSSAQRIGVHPRLLTIVQAAVGCNAGWTKSACGG